MKHEPTRQLQRPQLVRFSLFVERRERFWLRHLAKVRHQTIAALARRAVTEYLTHLDLADEHVPAARRAERPLHVPFVFSIEPERRRWLQQKARQTGTSVSALIRRALDESFEHLEHRPTRPQSWKEARDM
jgi:hypothetical protein